MTFEIDLATAEDDYRAKLRERGILAPSQLPVGKLTRVPVEGKPRGKDGAILWFDDGRPAGGYENHTDGIGWENWHAAGAQNLSDAERSAHKARVQAARERHDASEKRKAAEAARKAQTLIGTSHDARNDHPYIARKQIKAPATLREISQADAERIIGYPPKSDDEPLQGRLLVAPIYVNGTLSTVELIDESGRKSSIFGGTKKAGFWTTQALPDGDGAGLTVIIGEGVATVISAKMATGHIGVAALSCGSLLAVGKAIRQRYPRAKIVFVADLGVGAKKSTEAADAVGGSVAIPKFPAGVEGKDINDLHVACGLPAALACFSTASEEPLTMCLEGIKPESTTWLWYARLAVGKITVLDGAPGSGKSTMTCDAAARVSRGLPFPMDRHARSAGGVIFIAGEDGVADTVVPRLLAAGADLSKCFVWPANRLPYLPDGAPDIAKEIQRRQARLLIIDPITALFARDLSTNSDQDVRCALTPLAVAAEELGCCVLLLRHLNKRSGASAFDRGGGSVGIGALARVVLLVARDQSDPDQRILAAVKVNLTRPPRSLKARILDVDGVGKVDWGEECDVTADSLVAEPAPERKGKADEAAEIISNILADGDWHPQKEIEASLGGISRNTVNRAKESLGVKSTKRGAAWGWQLPFKVLKGGVVGTMGTLVSSFASREDGHLHSNNNNYLQDEDTHGAQDTNTPPHGHLDPKPGNDGHLPGDTGDLSDFDDGVLT